MKKTILFEEMAFLLNKLQFFHKKIKKTPFLRKNLVFRGKKHALINFLSSSARL